MSHRQEAEIGVRALRGVCRCDRLQGALVEVAAAKLLTPEKYLQFHRRIYASRGLIDGPRVLAAAQDVGLDQQQLAAAANTEATLEVLKSNADVRLGRAS